MQKNKIEIEGYVANYQEYETKNKKINSKFGLRIYNGKNREGERQYAFINMKAFEPLNIVNRQFVCVLGHIMVEEWKDKDGKDKQRDVIIVDKVDVMAMPYKSEPNKENGYINDDDVSF